MLCFDYPNEREAIGSARIFRTVIDAGQRARASAQVGTVIRAVHPESGEIEAKRPWYEATVADHAGIRHGAGPTPIEAVREASRHKESVTSFLLI